MNFTRSITTDIKIIAIKTIVIIEKVKERLLFESFTAEPVIAISDVMLKIENITASTIITVITSLFSTILILILLGYKYFLLKL